MNISALTQEIEHRDSLWQKLGGGSVALGIAPSLLRDLGIYGGAAGIWVNKSRTASIDPGGVGIAVSVLHNGETYADDFDATGVLYHYPHTKRAPAQDATEIAALKSAMRHRMPVFTITKSPDDKSLRDVYREYVIDWDDDAEVAFIEFADSMEDAESFAIKTSSQEFTLKVKSDHEVYGKVRRRPDQIRFRRAVLRMYGVRCAACSICTAELLDAAHIVSKREQGSDDPRNGLPFCPLHHRAFDSGLIAINPESLSFIATTDVDLATMCVTRSDIGHLKSTPHLQALEHAWSKRRQKDA